jgi:hypothetical protein
MWDYSNTKPTLYSRHQCNELCSKALHKELWRKSCGCWRYLQLAEPAKIGKESTNLLRLKRRWHIYAPILGVKLLRPMGWFIDWAITSPSKTRGSGCRVEWVYADYTHCHCQSSSWPTFCHQQGPNTGLFFNDAKEDTWACWRKDKSHSVINAQFKRAFAAQELIMELLCQLCI